jgi:hypothetical protein
VIRQMAIVSVVALVMVGCGGTTESSTNDNLPDDSGATSGTFVDDAGNTMQFGPGTTLPDNWPAAVPVAEGELLSVSVSQDGGALATWLIPDDRAQAILDDYLAQIQAAGFTQPTLSGMSVPDEGVYSYDSTGNGLDLTVSAVIAEQDSELTVIATAQPASGT